MATSPVEQRYSYQDYLTWPEDERWELIDGEAYAMTPAPQMDHQAISIAISSLLWAALLGKPCRAFYAPCDVFLSDHDVVEPDVLVVCDPTKITGKCVVGAPDLVVEILSPSTSTRDWREKRLLYERFGVREYIVVDPERQLVHRYLLGEGGKYGTNETFDAQQELALVTLPGLSLPLWTVFGVEKTEKKRQTPRSETGKAEEKA